MQRLLIASILLASACAADSTVDEFVGTWSYAPGAGFSGQCSTGQGYTQQMTGTTSFAKGVAADLTNTSSSGCVIEYDVAGSKASARSGQTCTSAGQSGTVMESLQADMLAVSSDGKQMTESLSGTFTISSGGSSVTCTAAGTWLLNKVSN